MALNCISLLRHQMNDAFELVRRAMDGVDDIMLHWEPAPGCWGLRLCDERWKLDYHLPDPIPPGPKTIGWLAGHLASVKEMHYHFLFDPWDKNWDELEIPGGADELRGYLERGQSLFLSAVGSLDDSDLIRKIVPPDSGGEKLALWQCLWFDIRHDIQHAGQIFQVRNEFTTTYPK